MLRIPFYSNSGDDTHCVQACLKSILKFYFPNKSYSFQYLDRVTAHKRGKWTWNSAMLMFLSRIGFEVIDIGGDLDYAKFSKQGEKYLKEMWTKEVFETQKKFSDIKNERKLAAILIKEKGVKLESKPATLRDIRKLFGKGYILLCSINPYVLERRKGYSGHMVLVTDVKKRTIQFHDPGLPPAKNRKTSIKLFLRAMRYPTREGASLIAIKLAKTTL